MKVATGRSRDDLDDTAVSSIVIEPGVDFRDCATKRHVSDEVDERVRVDLIRLQCVQRRIEPCHLPATGDFVYGGRNLSSIGNGRERVVSEADEAIAVDGIPNLCGRVGSVVHPHRVVACDCGREAQPFSTCSAPKDEPCCSAKLLMSWTTWSASALTS